MARSRRVLGIVVAVVSSSIAVIVGANVEGANFKITNRWKASRTSTLTSIHVAPRGGIAAPHSGPATVIAATDFIPSSDFHVIETGS